MIAAGLLVDEAQVVAAFNQHGLGDQDGRPLAAAPVAGVDVGGLERGIVHDVVGGLAVGNHPGVIAGVQIDRGDAAVRSFDQRDSPITLGVPSAPPPAMYCISDRSPPGCSAETYAAGGGGYVDHAGFGIDRSAHPVGSAARAGQLHRSQLAACRP